ncbi:hypothetical protein pEaSNUABM50_00497 [Erwinia phage pEa_SNUABM_50]|uniref:Uncharacterized protein n=2 Tax=Eneladusvirus BF TaxID=2560751 RepID=A0A7L8ZPW4_9CAUD|nr:hypothetical protein pEaSNUABM12_00559 [Erwinia phage pEa_SNUABM_12]QOI72493.1 hypothetical protein pEaSNUABM50_00497 [Erwinia phage pEa_SNUABM_50]QXO11621.1 hypothetical protein pEaSNUABM19_00504 [Erwinia phage pEa_SNUABM_19]
MQDQKEKTVAVIEYFELAYGAEERRLFQVFESTDSFEKYCIDNNIEIRKTGYGTYYSDATYAYNVKVMVVNQ